MTTVKYVLPGTGASSDMYAGVWYRIPDAYLRNDAMSRKWLDGDGPGSLPVINDRWRMK
jgi:hypothetical protein